MTDNIGVDGKREYLQMDNRLVLWRPTEVHSCEVMRGEAIDPETLPPPPPVTGPVIIECSACNQEKTLDEFDRDNRPRASKRHHRHTCCKVCRKQMRVSDKWKRG